MLLAPNLLCVYRRDPGLDIVLTFTSAYSCYFVAEELLGASGLLAVVVNGFTMSLIGEGGGGRN